MTQEIYEKAREEADTWLAMGQGLLLQGLESYPEQFEKITGVEDVADSFFSTHLNPYGDKFVHLGSFYGGSKFTMMGMDYLADEPSEEALMAGAFIATTLVGGTVEHLDPYFDMADMAANYAGWYLASEDYLDEGPTKRAYKGIKDGLQEIREGYGEPEG